jgi:hypothetical protein
MIIGAIFTIVVVSETSLVLFFGDGSLLGAEFIKVVDVLIKLLSLLLALLLGAAMS